MNLISGITFATPAALIALLALPAIWWLLRFTPPRPEQVRFPPFRLLLDLMTPEDQPDKTPWWLLLIRLALAALLIIAVARPQVGGDQGLAPDGRPLLIAIDNGWAAAADWQRREAALARLIDAAATRPVPVAVVATAPGRNTSVPQFLPADEARRRAAAIVPAAWALDRKGALARIKAATAERSGVQVVWLADGIDDGDARAFAAGLAALSGSGAAPTVLLPQKSRLAMALGKPQLAGGKLKVSVLRVPDQTPAETPVNILATNGRSLASATARFAPDSGKAELAFELPVELRNQAHRIDLTATRTAAGVHLFDDRWRRKTVGLVSGASLESDQPLLSPLYYVSRALAPVAEIRQVEPDQPVSSLLGSSLSVLVLADIGVLRADDRNAVAKWVEKGGMLVRFAGPRLASSNDDLVPVTLRAGDRTLGSALSWERPQGLAAFPDKSPFAGLTVDKSVTVSRQVLAEPSAELFDHTWASLADGTPLVTAARRGEGTIVLFHVTANADWSNLPLTGLFVEMLQRVVEMGPGALAGSDTGKPSAGAFVPKLVLDGRGELVTPDAAAEPIEARAFATLQPGPLHPPGLYERQGATRALNLTVAGDKLDAISGLPAGTSVAGYKAAPPRDLAGALFLIAALLFALDCLAALSLSGAWRRLLRRPGVATTMLAIALMAAACPHFAFAQDASANDASQSAADRFAMRAALDTRLAYVVTGDPQVDSATLAGLTGLTDILTGRTAVEPAAPMGVDIEKDEIVFFPLIYWPITADTPMPSQAALARLDAFMKNGGTIFFDTRNDNGDSLDFTGQPTPALQALRRILATLDIPPLEPVPPDHVLTKAFYLMQTFPGRYANGRLWVEAAGGDAQSTTRADGVSSIIIGSNDYAAAWAVDATGRPMFPCVPGGEQQREFAYRAGVNLVMYALTGNYKADQVHVPALLERLGQ